MSTTMTDLFGRAVDPPAHQFELGMQGRTRLGVQRRPTVLFCRDCNEVDQAMLMNAFGAPRCGSCASINVGEEVAEP